MYVDLLKIFRDKVTFLKVKCRIPVTVLASNIGLSKNTVYALLNPDKLPPMNAAKMIIVLETLDKVFALELIQMQISRRRKKRDASHDWHPGDRAALDHLRNKIYGLEDKAENVNRKVTALCEVALWLLLKYGDQDCHEIVDRLRIAATDNNKQKKRLTRRTTANGRSPAHRTAAK